VIGDFSRREKLRGQILKSVPFPLFPRKICVMYKISFLRPGVLLTFLLFILPGVILPTACYAHAVKIFASVVGGEIEGMVYFPGGGRFRDAPVGVYGPDNDKIGHLVTDDNGKFTFQPVGRIDYKFIIQTTDGHRAEFMVPADELPGDLGAVVNNDREDGPRQTTAKIGPPDRRHAEVVALSVPVKRDDLEKMIEQVVTRHVGPLRAQIEQYEHKIRLHDVLGGLGYLAGIWGVAFYLLAGKR